MSRWRVRQGSSTAIVVAETYATAKARAALLGFDMPDSIVLIG